MPKNKISDIALEDKRPDRDDFFTPYVAQTFNQETTRDATLSIQTIPPVGVLLSEYVLVLVVKGFLFDQNEGLRTPYIALVC